MSPDLRKFIYTALIFAGIFFILDGLIGIQIKPYFMASAGDYLNIYESLTDKNDADIIFIGNSHTEHGLDSSLISEMCRCQARNLSTSGGNIISTYYFMREYLEKNNPPKFLVLQAGDAGTTGFQQYGVHYFLLLHKLSGADQLGYFMQTFDLNLVAKKLVKFYQYRLSLRRYLNKDLTFSYKAPDRAKIDTFDPLIGQMLSEREKTLISTENSRSVEIPLDSAALSYLAKLGSLMSNRGVKLILVTPPEPLTWLHLVKSTTAIAEAVSKEAGVLGLLYYNFDTPSNPIVNQPSYFYDEQHLNSDGAHAYTLQVWDELGKIYVGNN